jgi:hypothetical protein
MLLRDARIFPRQPPAQIRRPADHRVANRNAQAGRGGDMALALGGHDTHCVISCVNIDPLETRRILLRSSKQVGSKHSASQPEGANELRADKLCNA